MCGLFVSPLRLSFHKVVLLMVVLRLDNSNFFEVLFFELFPVSKKKHLKLFQNVFFPNTERSELVVGADVVAHHSCVVRPVADMLRTEYLVAVTGIWVEQSERIQEGTPWVRRSVCLWVLLVAVRLQEAKLEGLVDGWRLLARLVIESPAEAIPSGAPNV